MRTAFASFLLWLAALAIMAGIAAICAAVEAVFFAAPAHAETIIACETVDLPGKEHTLNPFAPPKMQRQEKAKLCGPVEVPDHNQLEPIVDRKHDPRAWA